MKFTKRSIRHRKSLERKKQLVQILGGTVAATHSSAEVQMRHAAPKRPPSPEQLLPPSPPRNTRIRFAHLDPAERARIGYELRHPKEATECESTIN
jgi:hypothetical protein